MARLLISKSKISKFGLQKIKSVLSATSYRCAYCGVKLKKFDVTASPELSNDFFTIEHITPLSEGGGDERANLRAACLHCNGLRGNGSKEFLRFKLIAEKGKYPSFNLPQFNWLW